MFRKKITIALTIMFFVLIIGGCGKKSQEGLKELATGEVYSENGYSKDEQVTLSIIYAEAGVKKDFFEHAVKSFQEKFPNVTIKLQLMDGGIETYRKYIKTIIQSSDSAAMPDWIQELPGETATALAKMRKLEPQEEMLGRSFFDNPKLKVDEGSIVDARKLDATEHTYVLPNASSVAGVFFNKQLIKQYGLELPMIWADFLEFSSKIKARGIYPMVMAGKYASGYFDAGWGAIPYELGGEEYLQRVYNYEDDIYISEPYIEMLRRLDQYNKKGFIHPGTASFDHTQSQMELVQGKAAMITVGAWIANEMREVTPADFNWGFMPFPGIDNSQQDYYVRVATGNSGFIWKDKPEVVKKWAKEFNLWLYNLDVQKLSAMGGGTPSRKDFIEQAGNLEDISPSVAEALRSLSKPDVKVFNPSANNPEKMNRIKDSTALAKVSKTLGDGYIQIITGEKKPEEVAAAINTHYMKGLGKK